MTFFNQIQNQQTTILTLSKTVKILEEPAQHALNLIQNQRGNILGGGGGRLMNNNNNRQHIRSNFDVFIDQNTLKPKFKPAKFSGPEMLRPLDGVCVEHIAKK